MFENNERGTWVGLENDEIPTFVFEMKKYVLVSGGQLENKGAQAMTFLVVTKMKEKYPDSEVILFSDFDSNRKKEELSQYSFKVRAFPGWKNMIKWKVGLKDTVGIEYHAYFSNALCFIDISGYRLGSNWGVDTSLLYCKTLAYAKMFKIPVYIMPQSFGPFDYKGKRSFIVNWMIKHYLPYATVIMAREDEGKGLLEMRYGLKNVIKTSDMIIQSTEANPQYAYRTVPALKEIDVNKPSVAIIPNNKNIQYGSSDKLKSIYKDIINYIVSTGKKVYILYHSISDVQLCHDLKSDYLDDDRVVLIDEELSCFEYSNNISKFEYVVASRYHSIVHAYKKGIPALVIGWAIKYRDLTTDFQQGQYCIDVTNMDSDDIISRLNELNDNYSKESEVILNRLREIQTQDVFDYIKL